MSVIRKSLVHSLAPLALTAACGLLSTVPASAQQYSLTLLGVLPTGGFSYGNAVNDSGQVAGQSNVGGGNGMQVATLSSGGTLNDIDPAQSSANAINAAGQVTGIAQTSAPGAVTVNQAYVYSNGATTYLPGFGGNFSEGFGINNNGQVVGSSADANNNQKAFLYSSFNMIDLDKILGSGTNFNNSTANAISNSGKITGSVYGNYAYAYDSKSGTVTFLSSLTDPNPSDPNFGSGSVGNAINDSGQVAGYNVVSTGNEHAVLYGSDGTLTDLTPNIPSNTSAFGYGINAGGQVVGSVASGALFASPYAFLFSNGKLTDLNTLIAPGSGFDLFSAQGISDNGFITGYGFTQGNPGHIEAYLLTPNVAPEPSQTAALGVGLLGLAGLALRAKRRA